MALIKMPPLSILRLVQCLVAIVSLSLLSHLSSIINTSKSSISTPIQLNFALFTAVFTLLIILPYTTLAPRMFPKLAQRHAMMLAELSASIFWFAGMVALADWVRKGADGLKEDSSASARRDERNTAVAGTCFASLEFILFATSTSFALSHLLSSRTRQTQAQTKPSPSHHTQKASVSSISKLLPAHTKPDASTPTARTIHVDRSDNDPPYKRTQYRFDASARPLSFRSFKSVAVASKARSYRHFTLLRELQAQEDREKQAQKRWHGDGLNCGLGVGLGRGSSRKDKWSEKDWERIDQPNLIVVPAKGPGSDWTRGFSQDDLTAYRTQGTAADTPASRPYSTKILDAAGKVWDTASSVVADIGMKVKGRGSGGHAGWFRAIDDDDDEGSERGRMRVGISNPGGGRRQWNGAEVV